MADTDGTPPLPPYSLFFLFVQKPQAVDDDQRNMVRAQRQLEVQMRQIIQVAETDFNCDIDRAADEVQIALVGGNNGYSSCGCNLWWCNVV
jgi:hypothetical protein